MEEHPATIELPATAAETDSAPQLSEAQVHRDRKIFRRRCRGHGRDCFLGAFQWQWRRKRAAGVRSERNGLKRFLSPRASVVAAEAGITGPRWIAESVAVALEESAPTLEQEMELASAARVAAEAARNDFATATAVEVQAPVQWSMHVAPAVAAAASVTEAVATTESVPAPNFRKIVAETVGRRRRIVRRFKASRASGAKEESALRRCRCRRF